MTNLILHIGAPKTGTSSIQKFLNLNSESLSNQGFFIPSFLGNEVHAWLALLAFNLEREEPLVYEYGLKNLEERKAMRELKLNQFNQEIINHSDKEWIVSCEILFSRLRTEGEIVSLRNILKKFFRKIRIIAYLRKPIDSAISQWSTDTINGGTDLILPKPFCFRESFGYMDILKRWVKVFRFSEIKVRLFEKDFIYEGDLIKDFCYLSGIKSVDQLRLPRTENPRLSYFAQQVLARINTNIPSFTGKEVNNIRKDIASYFFDSFSSFPLYEPTNDEHEAYADFYAESDEWIRLNYFKERETLWRRKETFSDSEDYYKLNPPPEIAYAVGDTISRIWEEKISYINKLESLPQGK